MAAPLPTAVTDRVPCIAAYYLALSPLLIMGARGFFLAARAFTKKLTGAATQ